MEYNLGTCRKVRKLAKLTITSGTGDVKVEHVSGTKKRKSLQGGSPRGEINEISRKSVRRLMMKVRSLDTKGEWSMMTLTYLAQPISGKEASRHLGQMRQKLNKEYGEQNIKGIWWKEFQERGVLHFHAFLGFHPREQVVMDRRGRGYFRNATKLVSREWANITGEGDTKAVLASARLEPIRCKDGLSRYAAKYLAKSEQKEAPLNFSVGKAWGIWNEAALTYLASESYEGIDTASLTGCLKVSQEYSVFYSFQMARAEALQTVVGCQEILALPIVTPARDRIIKMLKMRQINGS